jgi:hypothetical protein
MREGPRPVVKGPSAVTGVAEGTLLACFEGCRTVCALVLLESYSARTEHERDEIKSISQKFWAKLERNGIHNLLPLSTCASMHQPAGNQCFSNLYTELCSIATLCETDNNSAISIFDFFKRDAHWLQKKARLITVRDFLSPTQKTLQNAHHAKRPLEREVYGSRRELDTLAPPDAG